MSEIKISLDGREFTGTDNQTILEIAQKNNIEIPTLCHDERVEMYGACGLCTVEIEGSPKLFRACCTIAANGMRVKTNTERIIKNRRTALELLLGDHFGDCLPPCTLACPAKTDCQGYAKFIAEEKYDEALKLIKEKIPFPSSIGRICPHPCEEACRRELVEESVSICALKQFAGDLNIEYNPEPGPPTYKHAAIVGGGPGGLAAAYFLRIQGHKATIYDAMPEMGGMLFYGVPEYRLPKEILRKEIECVKKMGVDFVNNTKIGRDISLNHLRESHDAVVIAVGAWGNAKLGCPGEELEGVLSAVDFLRETGKYDFTGLTAAVVGGSDVAMDACRVAVRLGAKKVYNIYRRTRDEMPAVAEEISGAAEEGVIFKPLRNPIEILGEANKAKSLRLQVMELKEADASGRRSSVAVAGEEETLEADIVISAIGQKLNGSGLEQIEKTKWGTIKACEQTFRTNLDGVFAIGDATNKGTDIAVSAIGEAKAAAEIIDKYLCGKNLTYEEPFIVKTEKTPGDFEDITKSPRIKRNLRDAGSRRGDFEEISPGFTKDEAKKEASRCLECGCGAYADCRLIKYANLYNAQNEKYKGEDRRHSKKEIADFIRLDKNKCVLCGLCVRICDEDAKKTLFGFVNRGYETVVDLFTDDFCPEDCRSCQKCAEACPTGALQKSAVTSY